MEFDTLTKSKRALILPKINSTSIVVSEVLYLNKLIHSSSLRIAEKFTEFIQIVCIGKQKDWFYVKSSNYKGKAGSLSYLSSQIASNKLFYSTHMHLYKNSIRDFPVVKFRNIVGLMT
jgi:hypothetical protein